MHEHEWCQRPIEHTRLPPGASGLLPGLLPSAHSRWRDAAPTGAVSRTLLAGPGALLRLAGCGVCTGGERIFRGGIVARKGSGAGAAAVDAMIPGWAVCTGGTIALIGCVAAAMSPDPAGLAVCTGWAFAGFTDAASVVCRVVGAAVVMPTTMSSVAACALEVVGGGVAFAVGAGVPDGGDVVVGDPCAWDTH